MTKPKTISDKKRLERLAHINYLISITKQDIDDYWKLKTILGTISTRTKETLASLIIERDELSRNLKP